MVLDGSAPLDRKEHNDFTRTKSRRSPSLQQNKFRKSRELSQKAAGGRIASRRVMLKLELLEAFT
jgi:hypothetical protein